MKDIVEKILAEVLKLPAEARAALAGRLLDSLDADVDADSEEARAKEIERRLREIEGGGTNVIPWSEARRRILADDEPTGR